MKYNYVIPQNSFIRFAFVYDALSITRKIFFTFSPIYLSQNNLHFSTYNYRHEDSFFFSFFRHFVLFQKKLTLITSVYDGDEYLDGFLQNISGLEGYSECEHLLIRAGSPGNEHERLVAHVQENPGAVYINLTNDPGLYGVWNLGVRLASGRYISNANIDDRRAPEQLATLLALLDAQPEISVASSPLRISKQKNLSWEESGSCPVMFAEAGGRAYQADSLFKQVGNSLVSRNLPHCMPVWRRYLHVVAGEFNEKRYGPSADWAFWLRAGHKGAKFYLTDKPLGLFLRGDGSYWQRKTRNKNYDAQIVSDFGSLAPTDKGTDEYPLSTELASAIDALRTGAMLQGIGMLLTSLAKPAAWTNKTRRLVDSVCLRYFGFTDAAAWVERFKNTAGMDQLSETAMFNALVELVQDSALHEQGILKSRVWRNLAFACLDWQECFGDGRGIILLALLSRRCGDLILEKQLLQQEYEADKLKFWNIVQSIYHFSRTLADFCSDFSCLAVPDALDETAKQSHICFYPDYRKGNQYQDLLYRDLVLREVNVYGTSNLTVFFETKFCDGKKNILHIHWINKLFSEEANVLNQVSLFEKNIYEAKRRGFFIYWTIHNKLSHDGSGGLVEKEFRKKLCTLSDKIFVHHPMVLELVDWIPEKTKLYLCEHGHYDLEQADNISQCAARAALGLVEDDFIVTHVGKIRDYKELAEYLPILAEQLEVMPRMKLIIAGKITSPETKTWLACHQHPRILVYNSFLADEDLVLHMRAADIGFLSYSEILTSGTLFHWMTCARPVFAPAKGTIPGYLVDAWNGVSYKSKEDFKKRLAYCASIPREEFVRMGNNALHTAKQLKWNMSL